MSLTEPDIIFVLDARRVPVAAKRPISRAQVIPRLREALKQLAQQQAQGLVAVSLDRVLPVTSPYFLAGSENAADAAIQKALVDAFRPYKHTAHDVMRSSPALGMVVSVCVVGYIRVPWQPTSETVILFLPRDDDLPEEEETVKKIVGVLRSPSA